MLVQEFNGDILVEEELYFSRGNGGSVSLLDRTYPLGSVYLSVSGTNPKELFGGEWAQIAEGRMLIGVDTQDSDFSIAEKTGGSKAHEAIVAHTHTIEPHSHTIGSHEHAIGAHSHAIGSHAHTVNGHTHSFSATTSSNGNHSHDLNEVGYYSPGASTSRYCGSRNVSYSLSTYASGAHTHTLSGTTGTSSPGTSSVQPSCSGTALTTDARQPSCSGTALTTGSTGGMSVEHMNPYFTVYMWKRTA